MEEEEPEIRPTSGFMNYFKNEMTPTYQNRTLFLNSPSMRRDNLMMSPLFSTRHQLTNLFRSFTPKSYQQTPRNESQRNLMFDELTLRNADVEANARMDKLIESLKSAINNNIELPANNDMNRDMAGGLDLDIDLINDTYLTMGKLSNTNIQFPTSQPTSKTSCKRFGDLTVSPTASFLMRKKI